MKNINKNFIYYVVALCFIWSCSNDNFENNEQGFNFVNRVAEISVVDTSSNVTQELAEKVANSFLPSVNKSTTRGGLFIQSVELVNDDLGNPSFYVINYKNKKGFVIVSASQEYMPILAYSNEGNFNIHNIDKSSVAYWVQVQKKTTQLHNEIPDSCKRLFKQMWTEYNTRKIKLATVRSDYDEVQELIMASVAKWNQEGYEVFTMTDLYSAGFYSLPQNVQNEILEKLNGYANQNYGDIYHNSFILKKRNVKTKGQSPLLTTTWWQMDGFNQFTPNNYPASCVAVAMAQIMKYNQYPLSYNWNNMANNYATETTAAFLRDIGASVSMDYQPTGSGATIGAALNAFKINFGYRNAQMVNHNGSVVCSQLDLKRPVFMRGVDQSINRGHAWVCDGYSSDVIIDEFIVKTLENTPSNIVPKKFTIVYTDPEYSYRTYFHMNWGWSYGDSNGNFYDDNVRIPEHNYNFSQGRQNIIDLYPVN